MPALTSPPSVKIIGANGQISLGKQFAGRQVLVEEKEAGVWLIRTATVIPDNERWLHETQAASDMARAQIIAQAATAVLAQANTSQQTVLKLLQG